MRKKRLIFSTAVIVNFLLDMSCTCLCGLESCDLLHIKFCQLSDLTQVSASACGGGGVWGGYIYHVELAYIMAAILYV